MKKIIDDAFISMLEQRDLYIDGAMNGLFGGERKSKAYGSSVEFADYREYARGDDLRRIDWNLYARFEKLYLKLYVDERQLYHRIYIDASSSMDWGKPSKGEVAVKIAAALAFLAVRGNDRVEIDVLRGSECTPLCRAFTGTEAFYRAADLLNGLKFHGSTDFGTALNATDNVGKDDGLSVIISDFLTENDFMGAIDRLVYRGRRVHLVQILSEDELSPSLRGKMTLFDIESDHEDDPRNVRSIISRSKIKAYEKALEWHQNEIKQFCNARGAGFFTVCSADPIEKILFMKAAEERLIK